MGLFDAKSLVTATLYARSDPGDIPGGRRSYDDVRRRRVQLNLAIPCRWTNSPGRDVAPGARELIVWRSGLRVERGQDDAPYPSAYRSHGISSNHTDRWESISEFSRRSAYFRRCGHRTLYWRLPPRSRSRLIAVQSSPGRPCVPKEQS